MANQDATASARPCDRCGAPARYHHPEHGEDWCRDCSIQIAGERVGTHDTAEEVLAFAVEALARSGLGAQDIHAVVDRATEREKVKEHGAGLITRREQWLDLLEPVEGDR